MIKLGKHDFLRGISQNLTSGICQSFVTTKPAGQGKGVGSAMGYHSVKAAGGEFKVVTIQGEETDFMIHLSI